MNADPASAALQQIYQTRFAGKAAYRTRVWHELARYFAQWIPGDGKVLDLGAGHCEFINNAAAAAKFAMDLNPATSEQATPGITILQQDCAAAWPLADSALDAVFTSNFLEHLPDKAAVSTVLGHAYRCLKPGGHLVALGPNVKYVPGEYWDFFDHYVPLTDLSLAEAMRLQGFEIVRRVDRFLPYTMSDGRQYPIWALRCYLATPAVWRWFGKQFLVVARKPAAPHTAPPAATPLPPRAAAPA
jgi:SAM-dependent methyltransferase